MKKHIPNIITSVRIVLSIILFFIMDYKIPFIVVYIVAGLSDNIDGFIARKIGAVTTLGARLDTFADLIMFAAAITVTLTWYAFPPFIWIILWCIVGVRVLNLLIGAIKFKKFISIHSVLNKATGVLLFLTPVILSFWAGNAYPLIVEIIAVLATLEELLMLCMMKEPDWDALWIFSLRKNKISP
jgi:Phosphatidylglycerophosphate synthase